MIFKASDFIVTVIPACLLLAMGGCGAPPQKPGPAKTAPLEPPALLASKSPRSRPRESPGPLSNGVIYQGPTGLKGWVAYDPKANDWRYADGALWTKSAHWISRDVHLPERSAVEFTLSNPGQVSAFFVSLYTHVPLKVTYSPS